MSGRSHLVVSMCVVVTAIAVGCGADGGSPAAQQGVDVEFLEGCSPIDSCERGECLEISYNKTVCTIECSDDAGCGSGFCVNSRCEPTCDFASRKDEVCVDGKLVACKDDGSPSCAVCGCPAGSACQADRCVVLKALDESCKANSDCASGFCFSAIKKCHLKQGDPCPGGLGCSGCVEYAGSSACAQCVTQGDESTCLLPCETYADLNVDCSDRSSRPEGGDVSVCLGEGSAACRTICEKDSDCGTSFQRCQSGACSVP